MQMYRNMYIYMFSLNTAYENSSSCESLETNIYYLSIFHIALLQKMTGFETHVTIYYTLFVQLENLTRKSVLTSFLLHNFHSK